jgi:hypothetical protein
MYPKVPTLELSNIITEIANINNVPIKLINEIITPNT